jgi:hypothetical protein
MTCPLHSAASRFTTLRYCPWLMFRADWTLSPPARPLPIELPGEGVQRQRMLPDIVLDHLLHRARRLEQVLAGLVGVALGEEAAEREAEQEQGTAATRVSVRSSMWRSGSATCARRRGPASAGPLATGSGRRRWRCQECR